MLAAVVLTALAATAVVVATSGSDPKHTPAVATAPPSSSVAATPIELGAVVRWLDANVAKDAPILASAATATVLRASGFAAASDAAGAPVAWVVVDPAVRRAHATFDVTGTLSRSVPVAAFGPVEVGSVLDVAPGPVLAAAKSAREDAGAELATNPGLRVDASDREAIRSGRLDLRAATVLALTAADTTVTVVDLPQDPAEAAAGRPLRTLVIIAEPAVVDSAVRSLPATYRAARVTAASSTFTVTWPAAVSP